MSFSNVNLGSLFATNHGTGTHLFLRQALRLKKTAFGTQRDEGTRAPGFPGRRKAMAESEGFSNFGIESKFLSPVPWPQWWG